MRPWKAFVSRRGDAVVASLIVAGALALLLATLNDYGMVWDEGFTIEREERLQEWFARVYQGSTSVRPAWSPEYSWLESRRAYRDRAGDQADSPWSRESLRFYWPFAREEPNGHPPFYAMLGLAGWTLSHRILTMPGPYRVGPALLFAMTLGAVYSTMARHYGRPAGLLAALGLIAMPRVFAHAHFASYDAPMLCLWFLAVSAFERAVNPLERRELASQDPAEPSAASGRPWAWTVAFGVAWGCAAATKLTGWFVPVPLVAWATLYRDRRAARTLLVGGLVSALVVYALNPTWWAEPVQSVRVFLESNLSREHLRPIPTQFFGQIYPFSLPWYNTLALTAIVVPPATLALALVGIGRIVAGRLHDRTGTLLLGCWAFFMVLRALPNTPGHGGERQFLPAFVFLACLSGIGLSAIAARVGRIAGIWLARVGAATILVLAVGAGTLSTWRYHPLQLSYFNSLIGGLSGAYRLGMDPTFYWDALTPDVRDWLNEHTSDGRTIAFAFPAVSFEYLHHWGLLRPKPIGRHDRSPQWFVVMNRPGQLRYFPESLGQLLLDHARPVYVKTLETAPDVPLILIFHGEDAIAADLFLERSKQNLSVPSPKLPASPRTTDDARPR